MRSQQGVGGERARLPVDRVNLPPAAAEVQRVGAPVRQALRRRAAPLHARVLADSLHAPRAAAGSQRAASSPRPPPPLVLSRTRRVPHPVLIGHAASLTPY